MNFTTFPPDTLLSSNILFPKQSHSTHIVEIITGEEDISHCDGLFSRNPSFSLGIKTADCAPVVFIGKEKFGVAHAGWRGLVDGILEKMIEEFADDSLQSVWIGPLHTCFEIQKDDCYSQIENRFGKGFFDESGGCIYFRFIDAIRSVLPDCAEFCEESTFSHEKWASWRRQGDLSGGQNMTIVGNF